MNQLLEVRMLSKTYGEQKVVDQVSFVLNGGRVLGLVGPNGAGKTTTVRMILGLAKPDTGQVLFREAPDRATSLPIHLAGILLENPGLHPGQTGRQRLLIQAARLGVPISRVDESLKKVGLEAAAKVRTKTYSLGMKQRLGLALAVLGQPRILILDEPTNGLDPAGIWWICGLIRGFAADGGSVLITSHLLGELEQVANDVVLLDRGRVQLYETMTNLHRRGSLEQVYRSETSSGSKE